MLEKIKKLLKLLEKHESLVTALINFNGVDTALQGGNVKNF